MIGEVGCRPQLSRVASVERLDTCVSEFAMTATHWKASHIFSIVAMAAVLMFFAFTAVAGESAPLLSSTTAQQSHVEQSASEVHVAERAS